MTLRKGFLATAFALLGLSPAWALDKVSYGTNWLAEAEHGGFYQAVADGTYAKYGLDVTIVQGGPQANNRMLLLAGKVEFYMGGGLGGLNAVAAGAPTLSVASLFQKDPQIIMSHPGVGLDTFKSLIDSPILIGKEVQANQFQWMKEAFGFKDENVRPYTFNSAPFIANPKAVQQGYVTSEPFAIEQQGHFKPNIFLLADQGYEAYSTTIDCTQDLVQKNPDLVQRFVDASIIGWYNYMYGDNKKANELIKKDNPDMTDAQIAYSIEAMKKYGIVDSGDAKTMGIGAITDARAKDFYEKMLKSGVLKSPLDYTKAISTKFIGKKVGMDLYPNR